MKQQKSLFLETGLDWVAAKAKKNQVPLLASLISGFMAYGFFFTNKLVNHDEVNLMFSKGGSVELGRWGLNILEFIFPNVSMPWIYGIITIFLMSIAACMIVNIFQIRNKLLQILLPGCIIVFPALIGTFSYMFTVSSYAVAFLLAVLAVQLIQNPTKVTILPALVCMVFSLGIYQAYISVASSLLVLICIQHLLRGTDVSRVLRKGITYLIFLGASLCSYYAVTKISMFIFQNSFSSYASNSIAFNLADVPSNILLAYKSFFRFFQEGYWGLIPTGFSRTMHWVLFVSAVVLLVWNSVQNRLNVSQSLLIVILTGILPLSINCMYLFTTEGSIHTLVLYGFVAVYVFIAILVDICIAAQKGNTSPLWHLSLDIVTLSMAMILISNTYLANASALNLHLRYENAYAFYTSLAADIKMMPEFNENTKLAVIGNPPDPAFYWEHLGAPNRVTGIYGFVPHSYSKHKFLEYYINFPIPFASDEEIEAIVSSPEYKEMPTYPYYGSMQYWGDILVVKLF